MKWFTHIVFICLFLWVQILQSQTVGVTDYSLNVNPGYTLFAPTINTNIYLVDECGQLINQWKADDKPGMMGKLTEDGSLIFAQRTKSVIFNAGGVGGTLSSYDWDGELLYSFKFASNDFHQHHDFEILPSGNILLLGWELVPEEELAKLGRADYPPTGVWSERIMEIDVIDKDTFEIVWEWRLIEHIVQDINPDLPTYGVISDHPEKININFTNQTLKTSDWLHCNSLDYNPDLDQIILNCRNFSEFWIIDHSTTTEEAKGSTGGLANKGGDILYRWGNPFAYNSGTPEDRAFFGQHDAHWVKSGIPGEGEIRVFNNGLGRPDGQYSTINNVIPPLDGFNYTKVNPAYGPEEATVVYGAKEGDQFFYSQRISGSQKLPNGNTLICQGTKGKLLEVEENDEIAWEYINPSGTIITTQGDFPQTAANAIFQAIKYEPDFIGFDGKDLTPGEKIELEPTDNCDLVPVDVAEIPLTAIHSYYDNINRQIVIENSQNYTISFHVYDITGNRIYADTNLSESLIRSDLYVQQSGIYFIQLWKDQDLFQTVKIHVINE